MKNVKIFKIIVKSFVLYIILCFLCLVLAITLCYFCIKKPDNIWLTFFKDVSVIIATTFGVSLLIGLLIEKNSKEDFYVDLTRDTINSDTFSKRISDEEKVNLCESMNKRFRCDNNDALYEIYSDLESRFVEQNFLKMNYYLEECRYDIICRITDSCIEKEFTKTMYFKSYCDKYSIKELPLGKYSNKFDEKDKCFEALSLSINGNTLSQSDLKKYVICTNANPDNRGPLLGTRNGYNNKIDCTYTEKIALNRMKAVPVSYKYITRTELSDNVLTVRCDKPCKKFSVNFKLENTDYAVKAVAFGFIDPAKNSPNTSSRQSVSVEFRNWILPEDGVVVLINKI